MGVLSITVGVDVTAVDAEVDGLGVASSADSGSRSSSDEEESMTEERVRVISFLQRGAREGVGVVGWDEEVATIRKGLDFDWGDRRAGSGAVLGLVRLRGLVEATFSFSGGVAC